MGEGKTPMLSLQSLKVVVDWLQYETRLQI